MVMKAGVSRKEALQQLVKAYRDAGRPWPVDMSSVAFWAIRNGKWRQRPVDIVQSLSRDLSKAMRDEMFTDPQGRRVRKNHAHRESVTSPDGEVSQRVLWLNIEEATPEQMHGSLQHRRNLVLADCHQLKTDTDSYNQNRNAGGTPIQLSFDFSEDLAELDEPTTYEGL
jgi:hypothetical protein